MFFVIVIFFPPPLSPLLLLLFLERRSTPSSFLWRCFSFSLFSVLSALIWYVFLLFFSLLFSPPTTIFSSPRLSVIEFVKIWDEGEAAAMEAELLSVFTGKREKPNSSSRAPPPAKDSGGTARGREEGAFYLSGKRS